MIRWTNLEGKTVILYNLILPGSSEPYGILRSIQLKLGFLCYCFENSGWKFSCKQKHVPHHHNIQLSKQLFVPQFMCDKNRKYLVNWSFVLTKIVIWFYLNSLRLLFHSTAGNDLHEDSKQNLNLFNMWYEASLIKTLFTIIRCRNGNYTTHVVWGLYLSQLYIL